MLTWIASVFASGPGTGGVTLLNLAAGSLGPTLATLLFAAAGTAIFWLLLLLPYRRLTRARRSAKETMEACGFVFFGCLLGFAVGMAMGLSRDPAVGAVVPAVLTLIGALVGYVYSKDSTANPSSKFTIVVAALALTTFFFSGTFAGATARGVWDQHARDFELYKLQYASDLDLHRIKYRAELARVERIHQAELERLHEGSESGRSKQ